ncbi:L-serine ammonia-lyase, iron-sulfur-dependent subunit beta [Brochothrix thermosphacta]|uniref:L-serine ammonia-lyase, iron-sulfur-dependent subunit beta n=1 Tax=Brochothrix thermosphacta TaxID=2756 RepID=UPI00083FAF2F|nr:L-serine ammonia-lyase, iron-sulfur-dependent subunit beta [Brochothrix thermosphacta]ODJ72648.1 L-serine dehydratase, iron-sulfur-dependent subunit beta [Brochothrix thermosphacta]
MKYESAFEIIGPVMVGPSSSHTAGAVRIGNIARQLCEFEPAVVRFELMGSFAETYQGHGTDLALLAGVMGYTTFSDEVADAKKIAEERQLRYSFDTVPVGNFHPNSVRVILISEDNKELILVASSLGGGKAEVQEIEKLPLKFTGEQPTLVFYHDDSIGFIADITLALTKRGYNIARFANERWNKGGKAISICVVDSVVSQSLLEEFNEEVPAITRSCFIQTV